MPKFIPYNYDQTSMVVLNFKDQLQPGTFEQMTTMTKGTLNLTA